MRRSFLVRLTLCSAILLIAFLVVLFPILRQSFDQAVRHFSNVRLEEEANALITAAKLDDGQLTMPDTLQDLSLNSARKNSRLGYFYKPDEASSSDAKKFDNNSFHLENTKADFRLSTDSLGRRYYVYDKEVNLGGPDLSVITMEPVTEYDILRTSFLKRFELWLTIALGFLLLLLALGLNWSLRPLRRLESQLYDIEAGKRDLLNENVPSEIRRLTRSLNRMLTTERLQSERYQDTLGDLAHSLKTPLTVLQNTIDDFKEVCSDTAQLDVMQEQIIRMRQQVTYQLQRATQRKGALIGQSIALKPLIASLVATLNKVYAEKQVSIQIEISEQLTVHAEDAALLELFGNLLENAYRLCSSTVIVKGYEASSKICVEIADDGSGIAPNKRKAVLQRGVRGDSLNPGQGIGLAVVQDILEGYQGYLEIDDSASLGGACFRVHLPI